MSILKEKFSSGVAAKLRDTFKLHNVHETPRVVKVTINARLGKGRDSKFIDTIADTLRRITGEDLGPQIDCRIQDS